MYVKVVFSALALAIGLLIYAGEAFAAGTSPECTLVVEEYVSNEDGAYHLGQTRVLARQHLTRAKNVVTGSHAPAFYVAKLQPDGSITATLSVKLDQFSDREEKTAFGHVQVEVEDVFSNFKDRYILSCEVGR